MKYPETVEHSCDVLVVGGGLAGCMAAIRAGELSEDVILVDKSNPERSGCAATGIDHIWGYFPEVQQAEGISLDDMVADHIDNIAKGLINREMIYYITKTSLNRILDLERFGAKIRYEDSTLPGRFRLQYQVHACRNTLHFDGRDVKRILTNAVRKQGVKIVDRVMASDLLLHDGQIAGAVGYGTRDGKLHLFRAKAVIMACGRPNRLYRTPSGLVFNHRMPPTLTGDGKAAMFRVGVEMINMEFVSIPGRWSSKNFVRGGGLPGGSYQPPGVGLNGLDEVIRPRNHDVIDYGETWKGTSTKVTSWARLMAELRAGRGPIYADMSWGSEEDQEYMRWAISHEGTGTAFLDVMEHYGLDFRLHKIELFPIEPEHSAFCASGPIVDESCQTNIPGLYAAGDEAGGIPQSVVPGALTMGYLSAESAAAFAKKVGRIPEGKGEEQLREFCAEIVARKRGDSWEEAQLTINNIMSDYNLELKSETMCRRGLECLDYVKRTMRLVAANPHEMTHCVEMRNLIECGEIVLRSTIERKESRYNLLQRLDYPERDDENFFCFLGQRMENGRIVFDKHYP
ncbi:MAG: FAD-dependent oxidoreductase [Deltaproteobacteria bacterium]|nr:MAG: FAD-dependent oxidoreductase [Deltaproteobacteria bacterium]